MMEISEKNKIELMKIHDIHKTDDGKEGFYKIYRSTERLLSELLFDRTKTNKEFTVAMIPKALQLYHTLIDRKYRYVKDSSYAAEQCYDGWVWASDATLIKAMYWCDPKKKDLRNEKKNFKKCMDALVELGFVHRKIVMVDFVDCYYYYPLYEKANTVINEEMGHRYSSQEAIDKMKQDNKERVSKQQTNEYDPFLDIEAEMQRILEAGEQGLAI